MLQRNECFVRSALSCSRGRGGRWSSHSERDEHRDARRDARGRGDSARAAVRHVGVRSRITYPTERDRCKYRKERGRYPAWISDRFRPPVRAISCRGGRYVSVSNAGYSSHASLVIWRKIRCEGDRRWSGNRRTLLFREWNALFFDDYVYLRTIQHAFIRNLTRVLRGKFLRGKPRLVVRNFGRWQDGADLERIVASYARIIVPFSCSSSLAIRKCVSCTIGNAVQGTARSSCLIINARMIIVARMSRVSQKDRQWKKREEEEAREASGNGEATLEWVLFY